MRKPTQTLDFWQFDVGLFDDGKTVELNEKYGPLGEAIFFRIMCYISETEGYYAKLSDALILYVYRSIGSKWVRNKQVISEVISYCGVCGLFDVNLLSQSIITSRGIQRRWLYAKKKNRAQGFSTAKFWLLDEKSEPGLSSHTQNYDNCNKKADNCNKKADKCNKNTNIKDNTSKVKSSKTEEAAPAELSAAAAELLSFYQKNMGMPMAPLTMEKLLAWMDDVDASLIEYAVEQAVKMGKRTWAYVEAILNNHANAGRKTRAEAEESNPKKSGSNAAPTKFTNFEQREYDYDAFERRSLGSCKNKGKESEKNGS